MESVKPKMAIAEPEIKVIPITKGKVSPKPCLELDKDDNTGINILHYALVNATMSEYDKGITICATFPSRRAIVVVENVGKTAGIVRYRNIEFYEFTPEQGWKFKKLYRTSLL
ncbi:hypothetical protein LCGC14_1105040 [marine sediment metagenome]|uniref:Uncharacterized protein n=1 Tax=marine sediment metagenome TaxID=412755 RepID=A0A0F9PRI3_9ZZZZ